MIFTTDNNIRYFKGGFFSRLRLIFFVFILYVAGGSSEVIPEVAANSFSPYRYVSDTEVIPLISGFALSDGNVETGFPKKNTKNPYSSAIEVLLTFAQKAMNNSAFTTPIEHNAFQLYQSVLLLDSNNSDAKLGIELIQKSYIKLLGQADDDSDEARIRSYYHRAKGVGVKQDILALYEHKFTKLAQTQNFADSVSSNVSGISNISGIRHTSTVNNQNAEAVFNLRRIGRAYQSQKMFSHAIPIYKQLVEIDRTDSNDWLGLAVSLDSDGKTEQANTAYKQVVELKHPSKKIMTFAQQRIRELSSSAVH